MILPTVVCGPVLRHCSSADAYIWFCTTQSVKFFGSAYSPTPFDARHSQPPKYQLVATGSTEYELRIGKRLFVQLLRLRIPSPSAALPSNTPIYYNIATSAPPAPAEGELADLPLWQLEAEVPLKDILARSDELLPSFILPGGVSEEVRAISSSCRKPHGLQRDALDEIDLFQPMNERPHLNVMLGDQIYADDVATQLLAEIRRLSHLLVGKDGVDKSFLKEFVLDTTESRKALVLNSGFTSTDSQNHLVAFGEFVCMYIYAFCTTQFRTLFSFRRPETTAKIDAYLVDEFEALTASITSYNKLTRIFANCPTYMIFDDHEVSDDWNIDSSWNQSNITPLRDSIIVRNALYSYFLFQGWGNCPAHTQWGPSILREVQADFDDFLGAIEEKDAAVLPNRVSSWDWHFEIPCARQICILDTRTRRQKVGIVDIFRLAKPDARSSPIPTSSDVWLRYSSYSDVTLIPGGAKGSGSGAQQIGALRDKYLVLISACPVFGNSVLQTGQTFDLNPYGLSEDPSQEGELIKRARRFVAERDFEDWCSHPLSLVRLFDTLIARGASNLVVVAGDIHAGYICQGVAEYKGKRIKFLQLVTSAAHNAPKSSIRALAAVGQTLGLVARGSEDFGLWIGQDSNRPPKASYTTASGQMIKATETKIGRPADIKISISRAQEPSGLIMKNNLGSLTLYANGAIACVLSEGKVARRQAWDC